MISIISGFLTGQIQFPAWLGKNSKRSKVDRTLQDLKAHTGLSARLSKMSLALDYGPVLRDHVISPLAEQGLVGVDQAVLNMGQYSLLREDLDGLMELTQWPDKPDPWKTLDSKIKAAFTRKYNKNVAILPYSMATIVSKKRKRVGGMEDTLSGEEDTLDEEDGEKMENDVSIKRLKINRV